LNAMDNFPEFMKNPKNAIAESNPARDIEGYVFNGADGSQMAFWQCRAGGVSEEHTHDFDEYFVVLKGCYTLIISGEKIPVHPGEEYHIPKGVPHAGEFIAGTRTIHAFGGKRADRKVESDNKLTP
jgi:quercetin dioxygenase-like cupin family protein